MIPAEAANPSNAYQWQTLADLPRPATWDAFAAWCEREGLAPVWSSFPCYLETSRETVERYRQFNGRNAAGEYVPACDFKKVFDEIASRCTAFLFSAGLNGKTSAPVTIFGLKQPVHGFTDRQEIKQDTNINITFGSGHAAPESFD